MANINEDVLQPAITGTGLVVTVAFAGEALRQTRKLGEMSEQPKKPTKRKKKLSEDELNLALW